MGSSLCVCVCTCACVRRETNDLPGGKRLEIVRRADLSFVRRPGAPTNHHLAATGRPASRSPCFSLTVTHIRAHACSHTGFAPPSSSSSLPPTSRAQQPIRRRSCFGCSMSRLIGHQQLPRSPRTHQSAPGCCLISSPRRRRMRVWRLKEKMRRRRRKMEWRIEWRRERRI